MLCYICVMCIEIYTATNKMKENVLYFIGRMVSIISLKKCNKYLKI